MGKNIRILWNKAQKVDFWLCLDPIWDFTLKTVSGIHDPRISWLHFGDQEITKCGDLLWLEKTFFWFLNSWYLRLKFVSNTFWTKIPKSSHSESGTVVTEAHFFIIIYMHWNLHKYLGRGYVWLRLDFFFCWFYHRHAASNTQSSLAEATAAVESQTYHITYQLKNKGQNCEGLECFSLDMNILNPRKLKNLKHGSLLGFTS